MRPPGLGDLLARTWANTSVSESGLFNKLFQSPDIKTQQVGTIAEPPYPEVAFDTPVERLSKLINRDNGAILSKDETGVFHIITKYDIIQSFAK